MAWSMNQIRDLHSWVDPSCSFVCTSLPAFASSAVDAILLLSLFFAVLLNSVNWSQSL